jgi:cytochrome c oxidase subunit 2
MGNFPLAPVEASEFAARYDNLFWWLTAVCAFFGVVTLILMTVLAVVYRRGSKVNRARAAHENLPLEISWTFLPLVLAVIFFWWGAKEFIYFKRPPKDATNIYVIGKQWMWHFEHESTGIRENDALHLPVDTPIKLTMISQDVLHALYIPEFRVQYQVVPGRYTDVWFIPTKVGKYHLFCGMFCGTQHSEMGGYVYVMTKGDYAAWLHNGGNDVQPMTLAERGAAKYAQMACANCHTETDTMRAPSLYGLYAKTRRFDDGTVAVADDAYLRESILDPYKHIVAGYTDTMPIYQGQIQEEDVFPLIAYIKSLGNAGKNVAPTPNTPERGQTPNPNVKGPTKQMADEAIGSENRDANRINHGKLAVEAEGSEH